MRRRSRSGVAAGDSSRASEPSARATGAGACPGFAPARRSAFSRRATSLPSAARGSSTSSWKASVTLRPSRIATEETLNSRQRVASLLHALAVRLRAQPGDRQEREAGRRGRQELLQLRGGRRGPAERLDFERGLPVASHGQMPDALSVLDAPPEDEPGAVEAPAGRVVVRLRVRAGRQRAAGKLGQLEVLDPPRSAGLSAAWAQFPTAGENRVGRFSPRAAPIVTSRTYCGFRVPFLRSSAKKRAPPKAGRAA